VLVRVQAVVFCVKFSDPHNKYSMQGTLYKFPLWNNIEFNKVCHFCYKSFSERFQVVIVGLLRGGGGGGESVIEKFNPF
jgi:hypothetical protein